MCNEDDWPVSRDAASKALELIEKAAAVANDGGLARRSAEEVGHTGVVVICCNT